MRPGQEVIHMSKLTVEVIGSHVLCLDAPLSFCHRDYPIALDELTRVADRQLVLSVFNRTGLMFPLGVEFDLTHFGKLQTVKEVFLHGNLDVTEELLKIRNTLMPSWHAFSARELTEELPTLNLIFWV